MNGEEVTSVGKKWLDTINNTIRYDNIKTIVTHQQFEEMEYKLWDN